MPTSARYPDGRSQHFTFFRRELFQKVAAVTLPFVILAKRSVMFSPLERPLPKFNLGDLIAADWVDESGEDIVEFGEVVGLCYLHEGDSSHPGNSWVYHVYWTHNSCGERDAAQFPCLDWDLSTGDDWRYVGHV